MAARPDSAVERMERLAAEEAKRLGPLSPEVAARAAVVLDRLGRDQKQKPA